MTIRQLIEAEAVAIGESGIWRDWTPHMIVNLQLFQERFCVGPSAFHEAIETVLGRSVWTHEFASSNIENLRREYLDGQAAPTLGEILALLPADKVFLVWAEDSLGNEEAT